MQTWRKGIKMFALKKQLVLKKRAACINFHYKEKNSA